MSTKEIAVTADHGSSALMTIISRAANDPAFDVAKLQQLLAVKKEWEADEARKAFVVALAAFKANPPEIYKSNRVHFDTQKGPTDYKHATLSDASSILGEAGSKVGLSHRWNVVQKDGKIAVTCILMHVLGHAESVTMECGADLTGNKNSIQAIGSAVTYLQRYTVFSAYGIAAKTDIDDDGQASEPPAKPIQGPQEAAAPPTPDPVVIRPGTVKKKGAEFLVPDLDGGETYYLLSEPEARALKLVNTNGGHARVLFSYKDGRRFIDSVDK